jgi:hypothetical protein
VAERLTTLIVDQGKAQVVERALLDKALGEIQLGMTGVLDPATTQKLGKVLGVSAIVTGTLIDLEENRTEVNARLIQTETGAILAAASTRLRRTWNDLPRPPAPARAAASPEEPDAPVRMSKLIPVSSPRRRAAPAVYHGPMQAAVVSDGGSADDVLTLTHEDLIPLRHRGETDPEHIIERFLTEADSPPPHAVRMARRIYHRHPDTRVRGRALMAMGHLLERSGRPRQAAQVYEQVLQEFSGADPLRTEARERLDHIDAHR